MAKAIAIIPARGGSKRIPKKNIKDFFGKPLVAYSIEVALASKLFDKVVVTTDDKEIAAIAKEYGAEVPFIRPPELSDDFTGTGDVVNHALEYLEKQDETYEFVCTIYATAPLLQKEFLIEGYEKLKESNAVNAFSATSMPFPIQRTFKLDKNERCEMFTPEHYMTRSQDLEEAYQDAGQFYWSKRNQESNKVMFSNDSIPIILPRHLVQDIDTLEDWQRAELMYKTLNQDKFDQWNDVKRKTDYKQRTIGIKPRDIFYIKLGQNVGSEEYGKGQDFVRPVLVLRQLTKELFVGVPLTSTLKHNDYFHTFSYTHKVKGTIENSAMILQLKTFSKKRLLNRIGMMHKEDFQNVLEKTGRLVNPTKRQVCPKANYETIIQ